MSTSDRSVDLVGGALLKPLLVLSLPIVLSNLLQVGYNIADTFWVGRLGQNAVTALGFSWPLVFLMISVGGGFSIAGSVLVAQNKGAGNDEQVDHVAGQTMGFVFAVAVVFSAIGYVLSPVLLPLVGTEVGTEVHRLAVEYTRTIFLGVPFVFGFFVFQSLLRGFGDTRTPLYLMAFGVALNVVLDPILILGFQDNVLFEALGLTGLQAELYAVTGFAGFGVQGAAIATVVARGIGALVGLGLLLGGYTGVTPAVLDFIPTWETIRQIVEVGAPASVEQSTRALGITAMTALVALAATEGAVAALSIGSRLTSLVFLPAIGLARGTETAVGQNLGADQPDRAERAVYLAGAILAVAMAVVSVVIYLGAEPIVAVFITGEGAAQVVDVGVEYLRIVAPTFVFLAVFRVVSGGFRGSGSTRTAMVFSILSLWAFRLPPAYALIVWENMGATGMWYAIAFSNVVTLIAAGGWFLRGTWREAVINEEAGPGPSVDVGPTEEHGDDEGAADEPEPAPNPDPATEREVDD
ncbi:MAG: MATE family efflux transporter [Halobacteriaceae archaeon]